MLQMGKPQSWWFDSNTGTRRSVWLQSTISDLDEKMKAMLKLIEEDGDSFAQRAEMYYKRRPELVTMVGDFYRMHRSLAEGFDQLKSEARSRLIRTYTPPTRPQKLLKVEKPYDNYAGDSEEFEVDDPEQDEHSHSYIGMEDEDYAESEVDDPEQEEKSHVGKEMEDEDCNESDVDDPKQKENKTNVGEIKMGNEESEEFGVVYPEQEHKLPVAVGKLSSIHREGDVLKLQAEVEKLKEENRILKQQLHGEYLGLIQEIEVAKLRGEMERLKEENMILKEQEFSCLVLESEFAKLKDETEKLKEEIRIQNLQLQGTVSSLIHESEGAKLRDELMRLREEIKVHKEQQESLHLFHENEAAKLRDEIVRLQSENKIQEEHLRGTRENSTLIGDLAKLKDEIGTLRKENMIQREQLFQKDEEKRQVIRQLSLSLDIMRENLNLSLSNRSIDNKSSQKKTQFEFSKFKEFFSAKKLFIGNYSKPHQTDQVLLQTLF